MTDYLHELHRELMLTEGKEVIININENGNKRYIRAITVGKDSEVRQISNNKIINFDELRDMSSQFEDFWVDIYTIQ